jgi:hypothetical protein
MEPTANGVSAQPDLSGRSNDTDFGILYTGFIKVPVDGKYTFSLMTDSDALLRLHEATVIDADFGHEPSKEVSASILLKAGMHPIRLYYAHHASASPILRLMWAGPGVGKQVIPATAFSHVVEDHTRKQR